MVQFFMLVGIPASGKSTWARSYKDFFNYEILSSDEYRAKYLGNAEDQTKNGYIFDLLRKDTIKMLNSGVNVCYDATNINRKDRRTILSEIDSQCKNVEKVCVVFMADSDIAKVRNDVRERKVPDYVIDRMLGRFEFPLESEGFNAITVVDNNDCKDYPDYTQMKIEMLGFDQKNPHHTLSLDKHCEMCEKTIDTDDKSLKIASGVHDYGKLFTQTVDEKNGICHYYNHENIGAYKAWFFNYPGGVSKVDVCRYICYHMQPYRIAKCTEEKAKKEIEYFDKNFYGNILRLHEADEKSH